MVLLALIGVFLGFVLLSSPFNRAYRLLGITALVGHTFLALVVIPRLPYQWDIQDFHGATMQLLVGILPTNSVSVNSFASFQAFIYAAFTPTPTTLSIINSLLAVLVAIPVSYIACNLYTEQVESTDGVISLVLFLPLPFLFLTIPMRDSLSLFLFFVSLALTVRGLVTSRQAFVLLIPSLAMLSMLRTELGLITIGGVSVAIGIYLLNTVAQREVSIVSLAVTTILISVGGLFVFANRFPLVKLNNMLSYRATGGAAYLVGMQYDSWFDVLLFLPVRMLYFQYAPFPLHVDSAFDVVALFTLPILVLLTVAAYRSVAGCKTRPAILVLLLVVYLGGIAGYGLIDSNFGTTVRHRIPFVFLLIVFASPVVERWEQSLRRRVGDRPRYDCE